MQSVTNKFLTAVVQDHVVATRFEVYPSSSRHAAFIYDPANNTSTNSDVRLIEGTVTYDKKADERSRCTLKLIDPTGSIVPLSGNDLFTPFGNEIKVYTGIDYKDGTAPEYVSMGTFRMSDITVAESEGGVTMQIEAKDRSRNISRNVVTFYYQPPANTKFSDAIRVILENRWADVTFDADATTWNNQMNDQTVVTHPAGMNPYQEGANMWAESRKLARAVGCDLYFDRSGVANFKRDPAFTYTSGAGLTPVYSFIEGQTAIFTSATRKLSDQNGYNQVIITGEGQGITALPLRSVPAQDTDPSSPTYINGSYGTVTMLESNPFMVTQAQVNDYAQLRLRQVIGGQESVEFPSIACPFLDIDDVIQVQRTRLGISKFNYIIESLSVPLTSGGQMTARLRERRTFV